MATKPPGMAHGVVLCVGHQMNFHWGQLQQLCQWVAAHHGKGTTIHLQVKLGITQKAIAGWEEHISPQLPPGLIACTLCAQPPEVPDPALEEEEEEGEEEAPAPTPVPTVSIGFELGQPLGMNNAKHNWACFDTIGLPFRDEAGPAPLEQQFECLGTIGHEPGPALIQPPAPIWHELGPSPVAHLPIASGWRHIESPAEVAHLPSVASSVVEDDNW